MSAVLGRLAPGALSLAAAIQGEAVMGRPAPHAWIRSMDRIVERAVAAPSLRASASAMSRELDDVRTALQSACDGFEGLHDDLQEIRTGLEATGETYRELEEAMDRYLGGDGDAFLAWAEAYLEMKLLDAPRSQHSQRRKEMLSRLRS
ncbi:MAG: hypothetical protein RIB45_17960 [Marivibrio sp.]|uniref:hypothetical protein n=1 Tax=Marivibrio sp. TaxID=2039719 RepID=UPI0032EEB749